MRLQNRPIAVEVRELGIDNGKNIKYKFRAICTSDDCRLKNKSNEERTDVGVIKRVPKTVDFCPHCEYALFWERYKN